MIRSAALPLALALAACATTPAAPVLSSVDYQRADDAETAARLLAIAATETSGDRHREAVTALRTMGLRALDGEADVVAQWAARLPPENLPPMRGRLLGPAYRTGLLAPGGRVETGQVFEGGRTARVSLSGAGTQPLALSVDDIKAKPVCRTEPGTPRNCRWTPAFSGRYAISIENVGDRPVQYFLVIG